MKRTTKKSKNSSSTEKASKVLALLALVVFAILGVVVLARTFAAPGGNGKPGGSGGSTSGPSLYVTPTSQKVMVGDTVSAAVWINTAGKSVNTVQADINYDTRYLEFVDIDGAGSAFDISAESSNSNGAIRIARGSISTVTGQNLVATVHLRATAKARSTKLTFAGTSVSLDATTQQNILTTLTGATYTIR